jgi:hypothetical protein
MSIQRRDSRSYEGICSGFVSRRAPPSIVLLLRLARSPSLTSNRLIKNCSWRNACSMADQAQASAVNRRLTCSQPIGTCIYSCNSPGFQSKWYAVPKPEN